MGGGDGDNAIVVIVLAAIGGMVLLGVVGAITVCWLVKRTSDSDNLSTADTELRSAPDTNYVDSFSGTSQGEDDHYMSVDALNRASGVRGDYVDSLGGADNNNVDTHYVGVDESVLPIHTDNYTKTLCTVDDNDDHYEGVTVPEDQT